MAASSSPAVAGRDLTKQFARYLDPHFLIPVFRYMKTKGVYPVEVADALLSKVMKSTKYTPKLASEMFPDVPTDGLIDESVLAREVQALYAEAGPQLAAAAESGFVDVDADSIRVTLSSLDALFRLSKLLYESGSYGPAAAGLKLWRKLCPGVTAVSNSDAALGALWGKFAGDIMGGDWEGANQARLDLTTAIDRSSSPKHVTQSQRAWAAHWSLFIFFRRPGGLDVLVDTLLMDSNRQVIQGLCPWLLRYVCAAVLMTRRRYVLHGLLALFREVSYRDPIVEFLELLIVKFDFEGAQAKLKECESVLVSDYFLGSNIPLADFLEAAKLQMFQLYCRLHATASLEFVAKLLDSDEDAAENWVVELIRSGQLKARISSSEKIVIVEPPQSRVHQIVAEKTKATLSRAQFVWNRLGFADRPSHKYK